MFGNIMFIVAAFVIASGMLIFKEKATKRSNRKILFNETQEYEIDELVENEPYVITYNDKRIYRKDVSDEIYQQLIQLDQAFTAFDKAREDYPLTMEELQESLGEEEE